MCAIVIESARGRWEHRFPPIAIFAAGFGVCQTDRLFGVNEFQPRDREGYFELLVMRDKITG